MISQRGRYRYLHPDRDRRVTEKSLGTNYGQEHLEKIFIQNGKELHKRKGAQTQKAPEVDYHDDPFAIFHYRTRLRLVVDLQTNVKAMQSKAYAQKAKITNLQQMADTLIYIQEHGYDTREDLSSAKEKIQDKMDNAQENLLNMTSEMKNLNSQIHYTGQYFASKNTYMDFVKSRNKKKFRNEHTSEISAYEEARDWLKNFYPDGKMLSLKSLKARKQNLQEKISSQKKIIHNYENYFRELETVSSNVDAILQRRTMETEKVHARTSKHQKLQKERTEETL